MAAGMSEMAERDRGMARELGANGGRSRTEAKVAAARENGRKGGRPRKRAAGYNGWIEP